VKRDVDLQPILLKLRSHAMTGCREILVEALTGMPLLSEPNDGVAVTP